MDLERARVDQAVELSDRPLIDDHIVAAEAAHRADLRLGHHAVGIGDAPAARTAAIADRPPRRRRS